MLDQFVHETLGLGGRKMFIERNDQKMSHTKSANQSDLMRGRREQMWRFLGSQYFFRVRIKGNYHGLSIHSLSVSRRSRNDCLMPEMDPVENAYREKKRTGQLRKLRNRTENFHHRNKSEIRTPNLETNSKFEIPIFKSGAMKAAHCFQS